MAVQKIVIQLLIFLFFLSLCIAAPFDSGWRKYTQPNGVTFTARQWGDEFESWMETDTGYRIIQGSDEYYYYAILDSRGEFAPYSDTVGVNPPLADSYQLERSAERLAKIEDEREAFNEQVRQNLQKPSTIKQ